MDITKARVESSNLEDCQLTIRLLHMLQKTKYELVQENGQRRMTAPEVIRGEKQRVKGAEVFVGRLPRDCYEDELMPVLEKVGRLMELRLMLDFSGSTRGYAFALFEDSKTARSACVKLDGYEIRPGHHIGVVKSMDNCRLFFGGVPKNKSKEDFLEELNKILDGITDIYLYPSAQDKSLNRGFIFVEFKDHRSAAMARRKLIPGRVVLWDHEIAVDWADPEPGDPIDDEIMESVTALFVRNLSLDMPHQTIRDIFQKNTKIPVIKLKKINHFAFIHYENRQAAQTVMDIMTRPNSIAEIEGWEIRWAKPIGATKLIERQRCIDEAVAKSKHYKRDQTNNKHVVAKSDIKDIVDINGNHIIDIVQMHITALRNLVKEKFDATCCFYCMRSTVMPSYTCKITIIKDGNVIFEYHGMLMPTKQNAILVACAKMYHFIATTYQNYVLFEEDYMEQKLHSNPMLKSPHNWNDETNYN